MMVERARWSRIAVFSVAIVVVCGVGAGCGSSKPKAATTVTTVASATTAAPATTSAPAVSQTQELAATPPPSGFPTGTYVVTLPEGGKVTGFQSGTWTMVLDATGHYSQKSGEVEFLGVYVVNGTEISFQQTNETDSCEGAGRYLWHLDATTMTFTSRGDGCHGGGRAIVLETKPYTKTA